MALLLLLLGLAAGDSCEDSALLQRHEQCHNLCHEPIKPGLFSVNDGPQPYELFQAGPTASEERVILTYKWLHTPGVRPDEAGLAFDLRCMFPVASLCDLPDPEDDAIWDWTYSDSFFAAMMKAGTAPFLKLGVNTWTSTRISGQSYVDWATGNVSYVIPPQVYFDCKPWPAISPVINAIGDRLVLKIVQRYNHAGLLEASKWPDAFAGVELMNEWNTLVCQPAGFPCGAKPPTVRDWEEFCYGRPWTWGSRYWDGTPEMAWDFYARTAKLLKQSFPGVRVGGPASGTSGSFFPCGDMSPESIGMSWINGFLRTVREREAPMDFFSWHYYGQGQGQTSMATDPEYHSEEFTFLSKSWHAYEKALAAHNFQHTPFVLSEFNGPFVLGNRSAYVGSMAGASTNAAKYAWMARQPRAHAAFLYQGLSGAFEALDPYSFPLGCSAHVEELNCSCPEVSLAEAPPINSTAPWRPPKSCCTPQDLLWENANGTYGPTGQWDSSCNCPLNALDGCTGCDDYHCQFGPNPESGMGEVYADGLLTPMSCLMLFLRSSQNSPRLDLLADGQKELEKEGVYALAWQHGRLATLLLTNPWPQAAMLPPANHLLPCREVRRAYRVAQFHKDHEVDSLHGVNSTVRLYGRRLRAEEMEGSCRRVLRPLKPFETVKLELHYSGCQC